MMVEITPSAGERQSQMFDVANDLLSGDVVSEVKINLTNTGETKYMRTYHTPEEIRKFIYADYESEDEYEARMDAYFKEKGLR